MSRFVSIFFLRMRSLFRRQTVDQELEKELQLHLDGLIAEYLGEGMTVEDARHAAKRAMGGLTQTAELCRDHRRMNFRENAIQDLKYSIRALHANPMITLIGISSLAVGIGANTLMFGIVQSILLRPLPYDEPSQLYWISQASPRMPGGVVLPPEFANWRQNTHAFSDLGAWNDTQFTLTGTREPKHVVAATVSAGFFRTLRSTPALGRGFTAAEDGSKPEHLAILSDNLWKLQFAADRRILGKSITLNSLAYTVVGVLAPGFRFPDESQPELYVPGGFSGPAEWNTPRMALLRVVGRLAAGVTVEGAARDLEMINKRHRAEIPTSYRRAFQDRVLQMPPLQQKLVGDLRPALFVLSGAVCLLLVLTCSNLAALQLARAFARSGEFAIRLALGGERKRLVQLLLTENLLAAGVGASLGIAGAYALLPLVRTLHALHLPSPSDLSINPVVLFAALAMTVGSAVMVGLGPALAASTLTPNEAMKNGASSLAGGSWSDRARSALVSIQIALALILVLAAGLLLKSAANVLNNPLGMQPANLVTAILRVDPQRYDNEQKTAALGEQIVGGIGQIPGVESTALTNALPFAGYSLGAAVVFEERPIPPPGARPSTPVIAITPDYLRTLEAPILAGRGVERSDRRESVRVAVVNHSFAVRFFPNSDAIGKRLRWGPDGAPWTEIVGIVADVRHRGQDVDPEPEIFVPFMQVPGNSLALAVRSALPLEALARALRGQLKKIDPNLPIFDVVTMEHRISSTLEPRRIELLVMGGLSLLAFFLAVTGVYGVINYAATTRTREFGVKLALGAKPSQIGFEVMRKGFLMAAGGLLPGLALSYLAARYLSSLLYRVKPEDLEAYAGATILLLAAILAACLPPAWRAARTDSVRALRWE